MVSGLKKYKWLILRRSCQMLVMGLFMLGPYAGIWIIEGNLASSNLLNTISLSDPFIALQSFVAGHELETTVIIGALTVAVFYMLVGGRSFCAWVCPINPVTDAANVMREKFRIKTNTKFDRRLRIALIPMILLVSYLAGEIAWEAVNPITILHRGVLFGLGAGSIVVFLIFILDFLVKKHGWCGHICPVGAFYGFLGRTNMIQISSKKRKKCNTCGDCFQHCPEPHVISPALFPETEDKSPLILDVDCIKCGKCVDVCHADVFSFTHRFDHKTLD